MSPGLRKGRKDQASVKMITCDLDVLPKMHIISISNPIEMLIYTYTDILSFSYPTKKSLIYYFNAVLLYGGTSLCHMVFTKHIEVGKISCLQWHVSSFELNMQLRDILHHFKPTAEAAASTSVFVHLILGQNTYKCFTTLGALPKHFFGFDVLSRSGQPQLSNLTRMTSQQEWANQSQKPLQNPLDDASYLENVGDIVTSTPPHCVYCDPKRTQRTIMFESH